MFDQSVSGGVKALHHCDHEVPVQVNGYDLVSALDMLAQLESEQTGQRKQFLQVWPFFHSMLSPQLVQVNLIQARYRIGCNFRLVILLVRSVSVGSHQL